MFKMRVTGIHRGLARVQRFEHGMKAMVGAALYREANRIMTDSKDNYVPVVNAKLRESGLVHPPVYAGSVVSVLLQYPGSGAVAVHENPRAGRTGGLSPQGERYPEGSYATQGGWKYLERPFFAAVPGMSQRIGWTWVLPCGC